jgi:ATP-dependent helicase HrpA
LRDKVVALIQQLSKPIRRALTPPQRFADAALESMMANRDQAMTVVLARALEELSGLKISADELAEDALDLHLRFLVRVIDEQGTELASGRDLVLIQQQLGDRAQRTFMDSQGDGFNRDGLVEWSVGDLGPSMTTTEGMHAWPALVDQGNAVGLRLFDTGSQAAAAHYEGVLRLLSMNLTDKLRYLGKQHGISQRALLAWGTVGSKEGLLDDLVNCSLAEAAGDLVNVRSEADFARTCDSVRSKLGGVSRKISDSFNRAMAIWLSVKSKLDGMEASRPEVWQDISTQLDDLVYEGFISDIGSSRLAHYERYLRAAEERLQNLNVNPASDTTRMGLIHPWWMRYLERVEEGGIYDEHLDAYRWLIEEYRVSLFAQKLGTAVKVSEKRLSQAWQTVTLP